MKLIIPEKDIFQQLTNAILIQMSAYQHELLPAIAIRLLPQTFETVDQRSIILTGLDFLYQAI